MWMEELPNGKYKFFERYENELFGKTKKFSVTLTSKSSRAQKEAKRMLDEKNQKFLKNFSLTKAGMNLTFEDVANEWFPKYLQTVKASTGKTQKRYFSLVMNNFPKEALISKSRYRHAAGLFRNDLLRKELWLRYSKEYQING